ncbi:MAG: Cna B-type domain-containing protein [Oscillospiraceae bacterium]|nr:Cna B-type domain-containing protein [Oscillospiraceae bacterium]
MKQKAKKDLKKRSIALFAAMAVCLTMAQAPAFTLSAHAEEAPAQGDIVQDENAQPVEENEEKDEEDLEKENPDEETSDEENLGSENQDGNPDENDGEVDPEKETEAPETEGENPPATDGTEDENAEVPEKSSLFESFYGECTEAIGSAEDQESVLQAIEGCLNRYDALTDEEKAELAEVYEMLLAYKAEVSGTAKGEAMNPLIEAAEGEEAPQADTLQAQIDAAEAGGTVVLTGDVNENITINKSLTLNLDGYTLTGTGEGSVVTVNGGEVVIENGTITGGKAEAGGGVYVSGADLTLNDVIINSNRAFGKKGWGGRGYQAMGGGLYIEDATVKMNGGSINNNVANYDAGHPDDYIEIDTYGGLGGGVFVSNGGSFILNGGEIDSNEAGYDAVKVDSFERLGYGSGGGVYVLGTGSFEMNGGDITNNTAYGRESGNNQNPRAAIGGGGVSVNNDNVHLNSGVISGNTSYAPGGGIYVHNGYELALQKVAITENDVDVLGGIQGGGVWYCNFAEGGYFYATSGALITNNQAAEKKGQDFFSVLPYNERKVHIATRLYDGTPITWKNDGTAKKGGLPWAPSWDFVEEEIDDLQAFIDKYINKMYVGLKSETTGSGSYQLQITDNHGTMGGGIACNGKLIMGEDKDIKLTVNKVWKDANDAVTEAPENVSVVVDIVNKANNKVIDTVTLNSENNWTAELIDLPGNIEYEVRERPVDGYETVYGEFVKNGSEWSVEIVNKTVAPKGSLIINKNLADNAPEEAKTKEYTFTVAGPNEYNETVTITGAGQKVLENLEPGAYTVTEQDAAINGYNWKVSVNGTSGSTVTVTVEGNADAAEATFTNSYDRPTTPPTKPEEPDEPEKPEEPDEPETPPTTPPTTPPETPPTEEVPEEEPPLTDIPDLEIPEEEVPLAEMPPEEEIPEEEVPLADIPKTGDTDGSLWAMLLAFCTAGVVLLARKLRGEKNS